MSQLSAVNLVTGWPGTHVDACAAAAAGMIMQRHRCSGLKFTMPTVRGTGSGPAASSYAAHSEMLRTKRGNWTDLLC